MRPSVLLINQGHEVVCEESVPPGSGIAEGHLAIGIVEKIFWELCFSVVRDE